MEKIIHLLQYKTSDYDKRLSQGQGSLRKPRMGFQRFRGGGGVKTSKNCSFLILNSFVVKCVELLLSMRVWRFKDFNL
ncbi:MAG: hypothetical protein LBG43_08565, partial [Treponema sp.]|nr:hypothetical protein [Treponema sp.]